MRTDKISIQQAVDIIQRGTGLNKTEIKDLSLADFTSLLDLVQEHNRTSLEIKRKVFSINHKS